MFLMNEPYNESFFWVRNAQVVFCFIIGRLTITFFSPCLLVAWNDIIPFLYDSFFVRFIILYCTTNKTRASGITRFSAVSLFTCDE